MNKIDLEKEFKQLYGAKAGAPAVVDVPAFDFLMIDGRGDPNRAPEFESAVQALYATAYALKFKIKKGPTALDYAVMPLEGLWWADDMRDFTQGRKDRWLWTMMVMQPAVVTRALLDEVLPEVQRKKPELALRQLRMERYAEGLSAQVLHIGAYDAEQPTIARLHAFIEANGCRPYGKHHEIYLGDPRKTAPEKLKTILRQPIARIKSV
jgi:hypothetical protein